MSPALAAVVHGKDMARCGALTASESRRRSKGSEGFERAKKENAGKQKEAQNQWSNHNKKQHAPNQTWGLAARTKGKLAQSELLQRQPALF